MDIVQYMGERGNGIVSSSPKDQSFTKAQKMSKKKVNELRNTIAATQGHEKKDLGGEVFCHGGPDAEGTCLFRRNGKDANELYLDNDLFPTLDKTSIQVWPCVADDADFAYAAMEISNLCFGLQYQADCADSLPVAIKADLENAHEILGALIKKL